MGEEEGQWEEFWGLIGGISEHDTLITSSKVLKGLLIVKTLGDIWGLLLNGDQNVAGLVIETLGGVIVTDILDGVTDDLLEVEMGLGGDFTENHDHTSFGGSLTGNLGQWILGQTSVQNGIRNLISDLVWVTLTDRLGSEEERSLEGVWVDVDAHLGDRVGSRRNERQLSLECRTEDQ
jgi:hypothetical protein